MLSFVTSEAPSHDLVGKSLQQKTEDALVDGPEGTRSVKHAQEQLEFMKKEQALLRHTLLSTKSQLRDVDQVWSILASALLVLVAASLMFIEFPSPCDVGPQESATKDGGAPNSNDERGAAKAGGTARSSVACSQPSGNDPSAAYNGADVAQPCPVSSQGKKLS